MFPQGVRGQGRSELAVATIFPLTCTPSLWAARTIRRGHWMSSHEARENGLARGAHRPRGTQGGRGNSAARLGAGGEAVLVAGGGGACGPGGVGRPGGCDFLCFADSPLGPLLAVSGSIDHCYALRISGVLRRGAGIRARYELAQIHRSSMQTWRTKA